MDVSSLYPGLRMQRVARLELYVLGSLLIHLDGQPIHGFRSAKERALLIYLAVENSRPLRRDTLAGLLWPETDDRTARNNLRLTLHRLRQTLNDTNSESALVQVDRETIWIKPQDSWCDAAFFSKLLEQVGKHRRHKLEDCLICYQRQAKAVDLYRGDFLEGFIPEGNLGFNEWTVLRREALHSRIMQILFGLAEYEMHYGKARQALNYAQRQLALEPWLEEAHRQVMRVYALDGQLTAALTQYKECKRVLSNDLGVEPADETVDLYNRILAARKMRRNNLPPQRTPFVGRLGELAHLETLLANPTCHLLTIVGSGGIGKTRLAMQAARCQINRFLHGLCFVSLAEIPSAKFLSTSIATALDLPSYDKSDSKKRLISYLRQKELLLVLDSFEHLVEGADLLAEILEMAPHVKFLITSQERLNLPGEWVFELRGLTFPASGAAGVEDANFESMELFVQTAQRTGTGGIDHGVWPSKDDRAFILQICELVEGTPLAIELAASLTHSLPLIFIVEGIRKNLDLLSPTHPGMHTRQHSIRSAFEYSWNLLAEEQQRIFSRLAVFRGRFSSAMAFTITDASPTLLGELVDKSLVRWYPSNKYDLHELLRQYACEQLNACPGEAHRIQSLHCSYFSNFLYEQQEALYGKGQIAAMQAIQEVIEDVRIAWTWAVEHRCYNEIKKSILSLSRFYENRSWFKEGAEALCLAMQSLENTGKDPLLASLLGRVLAFHGWFSFRLHQYDRACNLLTRSLELLPLPNSPVDRAISLSFIGNVAYWQEDYSKAQEYFEESLVLFRAQENRWGTAFCLICLSNLAYDRNRYLKAKEFAEEGEAIYREVGDPRAINFSSFSLARVYQALADYTEARRIYRHCLEIFIEIKDQWAQALAYNGLGVVALTLGNFKEADKNLNFGLFIFSEVDDSWGQATALTYLGSLAQARGEYEAAQEILLEALEIHRNIHFQGGAALALLYLAQVSQNLGEINEAEDLAQEALSTFSAVDDSRGIAYSKTVLGELAEARGNYYDASVMYKGSLMIFEDILHRWGVAYAQLCIGKLAYHQGVPTEAQSRLLRSLSIFWEIGALPYLLKNLVWLAQILYEQGEIERAAVILDCVLAQPAIFEETEKQATSILQTLSQIEVHRANLDVLVTELRLM